MSAVALVPQSAEGARSSGGDPGDERGCHAVLSGVTTSRRPMRACAGREIGWQPPADQPLRLTRRGRLLVNGLTVVVFGAAVVVLGLRATGALTDGPRSTATVSVQVGAGQTLWSIATETNPDRDPRAVIEQVLRLNGLRSAADVVPGQTLVVPAR